MNLFEEFTYLSTKNKYRYHILMGIFLRESERIHLELTEDFLYERYLSISEESDLDYGKSQLIRDLQYLVDNHNLSIQQENIQNIHTLEDYKNRKKYYSITKKGAFVARNIEQYLLLTNRTVLCDEHFKRVLEDIKECKHSNAYSAWNMFYEDCRNVFQIYQDFLAEFNGTRFDEITSTKEFLIYKKDFLEQIHLLIDKLSKYATIIGKELCQLEKDDVRLDSIKKWFLYVDDCEPTYITILHYCSMLIEKITRKAKVLVSAGEESADFKKVLHRFMACESLEECEELSSKLIGIQKMPHLNYHGPFSAKESERKDKSEINPEPFDESKKIEDERKALQYLKKEIEREEKILSMEKNHQISFADLSNFDTQETLTILSWLGRAMEDKNICSETPSGQSFVLKENKEENRIEFKTKHGILEMPDFSLVFEGEKNE
ncbi:MAG: DUF2397 family protein [Eubacteriales bacterium]|nr:DUF2397 family protein [Eubacteriales bacterium]